MRLDVEDLKKRLDASRDNESRLNEQIQVRSSISISFPRVVLELYIGRFHAVSSPAASLYALHHATGVVIYD